MSAAALKVALSFSGSLFTEIRPHLGKKRSGAGKGHGNAREHVCRKADVTLTAVTRPDSTTGQDVSRLRGVASGRQLVTRRARATGRSAYTPGRSRRISGTCRHVIKLKKLSRSVPVRVPLEVDLHLGTGPPPGRGADVRAARAWKNERHCRYTTTHKSWRVDSGRTAAAPLKVRRARHDPEDTLNGTTLGAVGLRANSRVRWPLTPGRHAGSRSRARLGGGREMGGGWAAKLENMRSMDMRTRERY